ncbi:MAG: hypothetical protein F6K42_30740 [Leptolyngbya sp. SIO1D8]|nr:hypothetical protein [Leptolyngbya sp. SIO1D8]
MLTLHWDGISLMTTSFYTYTFSTRDTPTENVGNEIAEESKDGIGWQLAGMDVCHWVCVLYCLRCWVCDCVLFSEKLTRSPITSPHP